MVPLEGNAPTSFDYQSSALLLSYKGIGSSGKNRTYTVHRMKVLHYHYATLPYRNTFQELRKDFPSAGRHYVFECVFVW